MMVRRRVVLSQWLMLMPMLLAGVVVLVTFEPSAQRASGAETVVIPSEPIKIKPGSPLSGRALVQRPASINGLMSWTLETRRHRGVIYHVSISPDGKTLATGGLDGTIRLWDVDTGKFIKCLLGHNSYVYRLAWSPDGNTLASAGAHDGSVGLWDVKTGVLRRAIRSPHGVVTYVAWAPSGTQLAFATGGSGHMLVYDVVRGEYLNNDKEKEVALGVGIVALEWSPDGQFVGFVSTTTPVSLWQLSAVRQNKFLLTEGDVNYSVAFSRDGKEVALAGAKAIRVYNFETEMVTRTIEAPAYSVAYSPDGKMLASAPSNGVVQLWEAGTGKPIKTLTGSATSSLSWSADSKLLATTTTTTAVVWDVETAKPKQTFDACGVYPPIWTPKMPFISGIYTNTPTVCDPASGKLQCKLEGHTAPVYAFAWSRDGKTLATGAADATVRLWEMPSGAPLATYKGHTAVVHAIAWMSDSKSLASASSDKTVRLWKAPDKKSAAGKKADEDKSAGKSGTEATTAETKATTDSGKKAVGKKDAKDPSDPLIQEFKGHAGPVTQLAAPSVGKLLVSGSTDKTIKVWNLTSNKLAATIDIGYPIQALAWTPDGKVLGSSSVDERLSYWNAATGKLIKDTGKSGNVASMSSMSFSPNNNGSIIAVGYRGGHALSLRDVQTDKVVHSLAAMAPVISATWTLSGQSIAAGCEDRTVRFWDITKGELRGHLIAEEGQVAAVSADGHFKAEPGIEADLFYVAQTDKSQETLSISDFATKAKWKNNPSQAAVIGK
ncbi:MAG: WD40 repeat domain-containing protein [Planctomycetaceae bacterium]|nr:WD40 repeat domain-containing protein [Planctomycetaceae bacterium]